ncbi:MAG: aminopeptidase P N-terminal domain-containing protein, partial [Gammaproteobacteria bacterium]|nr:aminopeptidase P N-terminal domain-containing protein [Gammaproteobacteria bacterium]
MISQQEFSRRRKQLMRMMGKDSIAIIPTATQQIRNRDVEYPFRPDSDFYYLTGLHEPDAIAVLIPKRPHGEYLLFCNERDPDMETWTGRRVGTGGAIEEFNADDAFPIGDV